MAEIIPVINTETFEEVKRKVVMLEPHASWVHIDVADGTFTPNILWHRSEDLLDLKTTLFVELHLMLGKIDEKIGGWLKPNVHRTIFHLEAVRNPDTVMDACHEAGIEAGLAIKPETDCTLLKPFFKEADLLQILAVSPGKTGQVFNEAMIEKIRKLRTLAPQAVIEVDGGVNADVARRAAHAGANLLAAGHVLFSAPDIENTIRELYRSANEQ